MQPATGWAKTLWFLSVLIVPIGVLVYLIVRGGKMHEHAAKDAQRQEREFSSYVRDVAGSQSPADQLSKLADRRDRGVITAEEFDREKAKILAKRHQGADDHTAVRIDAPGQRMAHRIRRIRHPAASRGQTAAALRSADACR